MISSCKEPIKYYCTKLIYSPPLPVLAVSNISTSSDTHYVSEWLASARCTRRLVKLRWGGGRLFLCQFISIKQDEVTHLQLNRIQDHTAIQYIQYTTVLNTTQYNRTQYNTIQYNKIEHKTTQHRTISRENISNQIMLNHH